MLAALLLAAALAILSSGYWWRRPARATFGPARYRRWAGALALRYGLTSVGALALLGGLPTVLALPVAFVPLATMLGYDPAAEMLPIWLVAASLAAGTAFNIGWTLLRRWRGKRPWELVPLPSIAPHWTAELPAAATLSVVAGVVEELFFRLLLPLLVALLSGVALPGFVLATIAFALLHRYQGWKGMVATGLVGIVLSVLYLASGQLWVAMAAHVAIDLNALVVRPAFSGALRRGWNKEHSA